MQILLRLLLILHLLILLSPSLCLGSDIVVIGDNRLTPVSDLITAIKEKIAPDTAVFTAREAEGRLLGIVRNERAKLVLVLGTEGLNDALTLPESIPVVYGLVLKPVVTRRHNVAGIYLSTPVSEYYELMGRYFPQIRKVGIVHEPDSAFFPNGGIQPSTVLYKARNPYEFVKGIKALGEKVDAFLLLPEKNLLSAAALEELFRESYFEKIPVIGVSEKHVKMGSLFALIFDNSRMSEQILALVRSTLKAGNAGEVTHGPAPKYHLYVNEKTAQAFGIPLSKELLRQARKVYP